MDNQSTNTLPSATNLLKSTLVFYKKNFKKFFALALFPFVLYVFTLAIGFFIGFTGSLTCNIGEVCKDYIAVDYMFILVPLILIIGIVSFVVSLLFHISLVMIVDKIDKGNNAFDLKNIYQDSAGLFFPYVWLMILIVLSTFTAYALLFIPAIILLVYISVSSYTLIVDGKRGIDAFSSSYYYISGNFWKVLFRLIFLALVTYATVFFLALVIYCLYITYSLIGSDSLGVLSFFNMAEQILNQASVFNLLMDISFQAVILGVCYPIFTIYFYLIYKDLKLKKSAPKPEVDFKKSRIWFKVIAIAGVFVIPLLIMLIMYLSYINIDKEKRMHMNQRFGEASLLDESFVNKENIIYSDADLESDLESLPE